MAQINASGQVLNALSLTKKLNRITNRNLGKDAKAGYKEQVVELPEEVKSEGNPGNEVNLEDDNTGYAGDDEHMDTLDSDDIKTEL